MIPTPSVYLHSNGSDIRKVNNSSYQNLLSLCVACCFLFCSCKVYPPTYYFKNVQRDTVISGFLPNDFQLKIRPNDLLSLSISSLNPGEDALYNKSGAVGEGLTGFQVDNAGDIYIHKLGKFTVAGLTRQDLKIKLEAALGQYLKDPIVTVGFSNHRVTVFGEKSSTIIEMPLEKVPLIEVLAKAGGVTPDSKLNKVLIIRESGNQKEFKHLNLEDQSIFTSPWYYLQPNDIVVVRPNEEKIATEQRRTRNQLMYTTILSAITFVFLIVDRIFR